jgi:NTE family protein
MSSIWMLLSARSRFARLFTLIVAATAAVVLSMLLSGCATQPNTASDETAPPKTGQVRPFDPSRLSVALVLSGGSLRGFAHIGVLQALDELGVAPDMIVGTSAGSLVGAGYAAGMSAAQIEVAMRTLDWSMVSDWVLPQLGQPILKGELGLVRGERLQQFADVLVGHRPIEALPRRLAIVATDLQSGAPAVFTAGNVGLAVRASSAIPGDFVPSVINGRRYIDGQVSSPLPVLAARALGADIVIAVDVTYPPEHAVITALPDVVFQAFMIASQRMVKTELQGADLVIRPRIPPSNQLWMEDRERLIDVGRSAALEIAMQLKGINGR